MANIEYLRALPPPHPTLSPPRGERDLVSLLVREGDLVSLLVWEGDLVSLLVKEGDLVSLLVVLSLWSSPCRGEEVWFIPLTRRI